MRRFLNIILIFMLFSGTACAQNKANISIEEIKNTFIESVTANWNDFKVCEYYSTTGEKKKFIEKSIDPSLTTGAEIITYKEIYVTNQESEETLHLGVVVVNYSISNQKNHISIQIEKDGYLKNTKILTRYLLKELDSKLIIYYSETFLDEKVKKYFTSLN